MEREHNTFLAASEAQGTFLPSTAQLDAAGDSHETVATFHNVVAAGPARRF